VFLYLPRRNQPNLHVASGKNLNCMEMAQALWPMFLLPFCSSSSSQECLKIWALSDLSTNPNAAAVEAQAQIERCV